MTFEQWQRRPVYLVQVYTSHILRTMSVYDSGQAFFDFRVLPTYRTERDRFIRKAVACKIRQMRRTLGLNRHAVRKESLAIMAQSTGTAIRCNLEEILA